MNSLVITYPSIAMFALTMACIFSLGWARYRAIHHGDVRISFFRTYNEGSQPERLHLLARHIQNHFEVPPLFHLGVILSYIADTVSLFAVIFAWTFVALRCVHLSLIHI